MNLVLVTLPALIAWMLHVGVASLYLGLFDSAKSLSFRLTHMLEIFLVGLIVFIVFFKFVDKVGLMPSIMVGLVTLAIIDLVFFVSYPKVWSNFDLWHVFGAYCVFGLAIALAQALSTS